MSGGVFSTTPRCSAFVPTRNAAHERTTQDAAAPAAFCRDDAPSWLAAAVTPLAAPVSGTRIATLVTVTIAILVDSGQLLWRRTRFS